MTNFLIILFFFGFVFGMFLWLKKSPSVSEEAEREERRGE